MRVVIVSGHTYTRIHALTSVVAAHETWINWYTPVTKAKEHSKQCTSTGEPAPKAAKTMLSARKVMSTRCDSTSFACGRSKWSQSSILPN